MSQSWPLSCWGQFHCRLHLRCWRRVPVKIDLCVPMSLSRCFEQLDIVSHFLQLFFQVRPPPLFRSFVDIRGSQFAVRFLPAQNMVDRLQDRMSYGDQGPFLAPSCRQPVVSGAVESVLCPGSRPCGLGQHRFYLLVAVGGSAAFFLPALSLLPGHMPAHEARCFSVGKAPMSNPISATRSSTVFLLKPGMALRFSRTLS